jgi:hypothetical protein
MSRSIRLRVIDRGKDAVTHDVSILGDAGDGCDHADHRVPVRHLGASVADGPGPSSPAENLLMVTEKVNAFAEGAATIAAGGTAHHVVKGYRQKVRANVQRLGC